MEPLEITPWTTDRLAYPRNAFWGQVKELQVDIVTCQSHSFPDYERGTRMPTESWED